MAMTRAEEILGLLKRHGAALDDDEIAARTGINRHYVNQVCRKLAEEGLVHREKGRDKKYVNWLGGSITAQLAPRRTNSNQRQRNRPLRARENVEALVADFDTCLRHFEASAAFPGPSLYFHERALAQRSRHQNARDLLDDDLFLEYIYAVLPAWGMHRMGNQRAKVGDFDDLAESFRSMLPEIERLWPMCITDIAEADAPALAGAIWDVIASLRVSTSKTRIVAGSKALHHVLPDLVPPIDRQYTFRFFTGQKSVSREAAAFQEWFPLLCQVGARCKLQIEAAIERSEFMATSPSKVIDNAIVGFVQLAGGDSL